MKNIILVDIDGTLADCTHRLHYIKKSPKNWPSFYGECYKDSEVFPVAEIVRKLQIFYFIVTCTGRSEHQGGHNIKELTRQWLRERCIWPHLMLFRPDNDHREDFIVKKEMVEKEGIKDKILFVLEDKANVVKMWRAWGLTCFQVAEGDF